MGFYQKGHIIEKGTDHVFKLPHSISSEACLDLTS